ncbi:MAG: hypothetical protein M3140_01220, partial [Actinomycetota bacterium]|nr:hypothetical protein [Actinomycetota bacterium]
MKRLLALAAVSAVITAGGLTAAAASYGNHPLDHNRVGPQGDGSQLTPVNQFVTPAGAVIRFDKGRLQDSGVSPNGRYAVALAWHDFSGFIAVFDLTTRRLVQEYHPTSGSGDVSFRGVLWAADGHTVWVAQSADLLKFPVSPPGRLGSPTVVTLPGSTSRLPLPSGFAWT